MFSIVNTWINARKEIKLKELEIAERRRWDEERKKEIAEKKERDSNKWALVKRQFETWTTTSRVPSIDGRETKVVYSFYENPLGDRKVVIDADRANYIDDEFKEKSLYWKLVCLTWLEGQNVKGIDTYEEAQQGILIDKLRGK